MSLIHCRTAPLRLGIRYRVLDLWNRMQGILDYPNALVGVGLLGQASYLGKVLYYWEGGGLQGVRTIC